MPVLRNESGQVTAIICGRSPKKKCAYCENHGTQLCDWENASGGTCDESICRLHAWHPPGEPNKDYCRLHRRLIEGDAREEKRKAELAAKKREGLVFIAQSKFPGSCKDKDCGARWEKGDPMYWDKQTREVFCVECGDLMDS